MNFINSFKFTLPKSGNEITFKILTGKDEKDIENEIKGLKKLYPQNSFDSTTRLKYMITSINGKVDEASIRKFVDELLLAPDARALREYYAKISGLYSIGTDMTESFPNTLKIDNEEFYKLVISIHGLSMEDTLIIHTKFIFKTDLEKTCEPNILIALLSTYEDIFFAKLIRQSSLI